VTACGDCLDAKHRYCAAGEPCCCGLSRDPDTGAYVDLATGLAPMRPPTYLPASAAVSEAKPVQCEFGARDHAPARYLVGVQGGCAYLACADHLSTPIHRSGAGYARVLYSPSGLWVLNRSVRGWWPE